MTAGPAAGHKKHYDSIEHIKRANKHWSEQVESRSWFFSEEERAWWGTEVLRDVYGGRFFVASNKPDIGGPGTGPRRYQVYRVEDDGHIIHVDRPDWHPDKSVWPGYESAQAAKQAAEVAAGEESRGVK